LSKGACSLRAWLARHPFRAAVYAIVLLCAIVAGIDFGLLHGRIAGGVAVALARMPAVRRVAQFQTARLAYREGGCRFFAEAAGISVTPPESNGLRVELGRVRLCNSAGQAERFVLRNAAGMILLSAESAGAEVARVPAAVKIGGIAAGSNPPLVTVRGVDLNAVVSEKTVVLERISATGVRVGDDLLAIPGVSVPALTLPRTDQPEITIPLIAVAGADAAPGTSAGRNLAAARCRRRTRARLQPAGRVQYDVGRLRQDRAFHPCVRVLAGARRHAHRGGWQAGADGRPAVAACDFRALRRLPGTCCTGSRCREPFAYLAAGGAIAGGLAIFMYRHTPEWHQRWEPAVVDVTGARHDRPLARVHAFTLAPLPGQPRRVAVARVEIGPVGAALAADGLGSAAVRIEGAQVETGRLGPCRARFAGHPASRPAR